MLSTNIIEQTELITKWQVAIDPTTDLTGVPDGIYPFNGLVDQWAVVIGEQAVNWACTYGMICLMYIEAMRVQKEHVTRNPANDLGKWWTIRTGDYTASISRDGEISYEDC